MAKKKRHRRQKRKREEVSPQVISQPVKNEKFQAKKSSPAKKYIIAAAAVLIIVAALFLAFRLLFPKSKIVVDGGLNVLLVTLDTTRADRLGYAGYARAKTPNLDYLATNGVRFTNAYSQVPLTTPSHCSILTGTYPLFHRVRNNGTYVLPAELTTLAERLKEKGLKTAAFVASFTVDSRLGLDQGFDLYDDNFVADQTFKTLNSERKAEAVSSAFARWLDGFKSEQFFAWVHFFDPHFPYTPPSPFHEEFADTPYDGEVAYMDQHVGKIIDKLREKNLLGSTLVVLAGDHGEAFGEKGEVGHGIFLYEPTLRVPLIFYAQGHLPSKVVIEPRVRLIDIMPTVLEMLGLPLSPDIQGTSLLPHIQRKKRADLPSYIETYFPRENYGWSELQGFIEGDWKYIRAPKQELYNLRQDPGEAHNAIAQEPKIFAEKTKKFQESVAAAASPLKEEKRKLTAEERERLRSLGYVAFAEGGPKENLADPKDMVADLKLMNEAESLEVAGKLEEAAGIYKKILAQQPENPSSYINLALVQGKMKRFEDAISTLQDGLQKIPGSEMLLTRLGHTYMVVGRLKKALDTMNAVLVINPQNFDALLASGWATDLMGQNEEARGFYEKALQIEPENKFLRKNYALNLAQGGRLREAIGLYEKIKADYPDDYEIYQDLGIAYGYAGDLSAAIDSLKKAVELHPTPSAYYNLAVALSKVGNLEEAVNYLRLYLENPEGEAPEKVEAARQQLQGLEKIKR
jgi:tetratricopeptide (TPR) repeat protein